MPSSGAFFHNTISRVHMRFNWLPAIAAGYLGRMPTSRTFFDIIFRRLINFNSPPAAAATLSISGDPNTITTSLPSPPNNLNSPTQSDRPIVLFIPSPDLELGNQPSPVPTPDYTDIDLLEWKRIGKDAQTVGFGGIGILITILVSTPDSATTHAALYIAYLSLASLGMATSICLSLYSLIMKASPVVGMVQKKLIYFTLFFVVLACFFHLEIAPPPIDLRFVTVPTLIGMLVIALYLFLCCRCQR